MISTGSLVELEASIGGSRRTFGGTVQRSAEDVLAFRIPCQRRRRPFPVGTEVRVDVVQGSEVLRFAAPVTALMVNAESIIVEITLPDSIEIDHREYFRLAWRLPVTIRWTGAPRDGRIQLLTEDLGGGGFGVITADRHEVGQRATAVLHLTDIGDFDAKVRVARINEIAFSDPTSFRVGLAFDALPKSSRERLIHCIFQKQLEIRRRDLNC